MPAIYHSACRSNMKIGNIGKLTFKTKFNGPVKGLNEEHLRQEEPLKIDIIDEALYFFKSNIFFSNYEIMSESDRNLVYLTLYIVECLKSISKSNNNRIQAQQDLTNMALNWFAIPGDPKFPLNNLFQKPTNTSEADEMRSYMTQMRQECGQRLMEIVWPTNEKKPSKWWMCFAKRRFINISLNEVSTY